MTFGELEKCNEKDFCSFLASFLASSKNKKRFARNKIQLATFNQNIKLVGKLQQFIDHYDNMSDIALRSLQLVKQSPLNYRK